MGNGRNMNLFRIKLLYLQAYIKVLTTIQIIKLKKDKLLVYYNPITMKKLLFILAVVLFTGCQHSPVKSFILESYPTATEIVIEEDSAYNAYWDILHLNRKCSETIQKLTDISKKERYQIIDSLQLEAMPIHVHLEDVFMTPKINSKAYKVRFNLNGIPHQTAVFQLPLGENNYISQEDIEQKFEEVLDKIENMK